MLDYHNSFTVTDLKQYEFCQRVVYYERCLPHLRPRTFKMDAGREAHTIEHKLATRRTLSRYHIVSGERRFDVAVQSERLLLVGVIDEVVFAEHGEVIPVDYKLAKRVGSHHRLQLCAYAMLLEETLSTSVDHGFLYLIPVRQVVEVHFNEALRQSVEATVSEMQAMVELERMPPPAKQVSRCVACEFRRFCNDIGL